jgi:hypothetical protein
MSSFVSSLKTLECDNLYYCFLAQSFVVGGFNDFCQARSKNRGDHCASLRDGRGGEGRGGGRRQLEP